MFRTLSLLFPENGSHLKCSGIKSEFFNFESSEEFNSAVRLCLLYEPTWCVQVLRSPKEAFAAAMQSWSERCEKCVCLPGDYVVK